MIDSGGKLSESMRNRANQIGSGNRTPAGLSGCDVARESVEIHAQRQRMRPGFSTELRSEARKHPGEHIAHARRRHSRIASGIDPRLFVGRRDYRLVAFQNHDGLPVRGGLAGGMQTALLYLFCSGPEQPRHFSRMRSEGVHAARAAEFACTACEGIQTISVEDHWDLRFARDNGANELQSVLVSGQPRTDGDGILATKDAENPPESKTSRAMVPAVVA